MLRATALMRETVARSLPTNGGDNDKDGSYTDYNWGALPAQAGMILSCTPSWGDVYRCSPLRQE